MDTGVHKDLESGKSEIVQSYPKRPKHGDPLDAANKKTGSYNHSSNQATHGDSDQNNPYSFVNNNLVRDPPPDFSSFFRSVESGDTSIRTSVKDSKSDKSRIDNSYPVKTGDCDHNPFRWVEEDVSPVPPEFSRYFGFVKSGDTSIQTTVKDSKSDKSGIDNSYPEKTGDYAHLLRSWAKVVPSVLDRVPPPDFSCVSRSLEPGDAGFTITVKDSKSDKIEIDNSYPEKTGDYDTSIQTTVKDLKLSKEIVSYLNKMNGPIGEDPRIAPTKEDVESDDTIMALYKRWCHLNKISRTPEEMKQRFSFFKNKAIDVFESNRDSKYCKRGLFPWADDPTLEPRGGVIWDLSSRNGDRGLYPWVNDPTLEPRGG